MNYYILKIYRAAILAPLLLFVGWTNSSVDGCYVKCREYAAMTGEIICMFDGNYQYWAYSDVAIMSKPEYPIIGTYSIEGDRITFSSTSNDSVTPRIICALADQRVLLTTETYEAYLKTGNINPHGMLVYAKDKTSEQLFFDMNNYSNIPSIRLLSEYIQDNHGEKGEGEHPLNRMIHDIKGQ